MGAEVAVEHLQHCDIAKFNRQREHGVLLRATRTILMHLVFQLLELPEHADSALGGVSGRLGPLRAFAIRLKLCASRRRWKLPSLTSSMTI